MALDLMCPNCGSVVGELDNNESIYYYSDKHKNPICNNCGDNNSNVLLFIPIVLFSQIISYLILSLFI